MTEEEIMMLAERVAHGTKKVGGSRRLPFCDIIEMENGKVKPLTSFDV